MSLDDDYQTIFNIERACLRKNGMLITSFEKQARRLIWNQ